MLLVCLTAGDIWISLRPILNLVETLFFAIEALDLDHIESVDEERLFNSVIQWTIR